MRVIPGMTLNLMSLGGLAVAIGLVVDDAIVVTEGIVRRLEEGHPRDEAIELGMKDMFAAVVGTTVTTVVVFAPLALLSGVTGHFLGALAITLAIAVVLSMVLALSLLPLLANLLRARPAREAAAGDRAGRVDRAIGWLVRRKLVAVLVVVALLGVGYVARGALATGFLPQMDEGAFVVDFFLPAGTSLEETDRLATAIDAVLRDTPEVATFTRRTGTELGPAAATMQSRGDIMVRLVPRARRDDIREVIARVRAKLHDTVPEARFEYMQVLQDVLADLAGNPAPIEIKRARRRPGAAARVRRGRRRAPREGRPARRRVRRPRGRDADPALARRRAGARAPGPARRRRRQRPRGRARRPRGRAAVAAGAQRSACASATPTTCATRRPRSRGR